LTILLSFFPLAFIDNLGVSVASESLLPELFSVAVFQALLPLALVNETI
jgi:hypothetical protein